MALAMARQFHRGKPLDGAPSRKHYRPPKGGKMVTNLGQLALGLSPFLMVSVGIWPGLNLSPSASDSARLQRFYFCHFGLVASPSAIVDFHIHAGLHISAYYRLVMHH